MSIQNLMDVLAAPKLRLDKSGEEHHWNLIEADLGFVLPSEYKDFISVYGVGWINDYILLLSPFYPEEQFNLKHQSQHLIATYNALKEAHPGKYTHATFPEKDGIFPFGITGAGVLYWKMIGVPDNWSIVLYGSGGGRFEEYTCTLTEFLLGLLNNDIKSKLLAEDLTEDPPEFEPEC